VNGSLSSAIDTAYENEKPRDYRSSRVGASIAGNPCTAFLAMALRGFPEHPPTPRLKRIFGAGHRIEDVVVHDLKKAGYSVTEKDAFTNKQYMWEKYDGNSVYYADGIIEINGEAYLLEVKSMNDSLFNRFKDRGVKVSHRKYFDQMQIGMGYSGFPKSILIAYNKNTCEYWDELIEYNPIDYSALIINVEKAIYGQEEKVGEDPQDWRCKDCWKKDWCWGNDPLPMDMRTCQNSYIDEHTGKWECKNGCVGTCQSWIRYRPPEKGSGK